LSEPRPDASVQAPTASPFGDRVPARLRGFGPVGIAAMLVILLVGNYPVAPLSGILVLVWVGWSRTAWREIGYVRPKSWMRDLAAGIALGIAFKFLMKAIVMPLLGAPPINQAYHYLTGNPAALPGAGYLMIAGGGFGEETVFRGFLFERFGLRWPTTLNKGAPASSKPRSPGSCSERSSPSRAGSGFPCSRTLPST